METQGTTSNNLEDDNSEKYILETSTRTIKTEHFRLSGQWMILVWKTDLCPNPVSLHNILLRLNIWKLFKHFTGLTAEAS